MTKRIDCYNSQGKKVCEIYPAELSDRELTLTLELQAHQGRVCLLEVYQEKEEKKMKKTKKMKKNELKIGDKVRCIDDSHSFNKLRKGNTYTVEKGWHGSPTVVVSGATYNLDRFNLIKEGKP